MEVDSDKAVELITGAAETRLEEAIRKLVSMYHDGKGVARDYEISAGWQEKLVEILEEKYRSSQSCSRRIPTDGFAEQNGRDAERAD